MSIVVEKVEFPSISLTTLGFTPKLIIRVANASRLSCSLDPRLWGCNRVEMVLGHLAPTSPTF